MRKESSTVQKCKRQMATLGFDSQLAYHRVKLILKIYRDVVWVLSERVEELHEYAWELGAQDADTGLIYLQSFAPDMDLQEFEERVCCVMENRMLVDVIDRALLRLKRYPDRGELYYEILTKQFIHRFNSTEKELLDELNAKSFCCYGFDCYERYWDITDEEYLAQLETKREEITHEILERCRTKRKNLYITGPVALNVAQKFSVHRLCDKEGKHNLANRFVGELMEQLVQDGLLVTRKTRNGPGVRTATDAEISSPLPGQQQMTL